MIKLRAHACAKSCTKYLLLIMITIVLISPSATSSLTQNIVVPSTGIVVGSSEVNATSGSPADIQAAVNAVNYVGGGTVYVPAGTFDWYGGQVTIPGGVSVIGASPAGCMGHENNWKHYTPSTILLNHGQNNPDMFVVNGGNGKPTRISGIQFEAADDPTSESTSGGPGAMSLFECKNFRIDHCNFINFAHHQIQVVARTSRWALKLEHSAYGVIDHCFFDAPYKDNGGTWQVAYGVLAIGNMQPELNNWNNQGVQYYAGKYQEFTDVALVYVEDCNFRRMRHSVDGNDGDITVTRYCLFDHIADEGNAKWNAGEVCLHPSWEAQYPPLLQECYNNLFTNDGALGDPTPKQTTSRSMHRECPVHPNQPHSMLAITQRGTSGIYHHNEYYQSEPAPNWASTFINLQDESYDPSIGKIRDTYIWGNTYTNVFNHDDNGDGILDGYVSCSGNPTPQLDVSFFMRQPNLTQDGWTYTPYPYPHPLVGS